MNESTQRRGRLELVLGLLLGTLLVMASTHAVVAQVGNEWVGKRVIIKSGAVLRAGKSIVRDDGSALRKDTRIYRVEQANGPWLWLKAETSSTAGWVRAEWLSHSV